MGFWDFLTEMVHKDASATAILGIVVCGLILMGFMYGASIWSGKESQISPPIVDAVKAILLVAVGYFTGRSAKPQVQRIRPKGN